jgi:predicted DNA-binding transcriptional regulator YafY
LESSAAAPNLAPSVPDAVDMKRLRICIRARGKWRIRYEDKRGRASERVVWPLTVA